MRLTPTELDRLTIFTAAELARRRRARAWKLNHPEALAIICDEMQSIDNINTLAPLLPHAYAPVPRPSRPQPRTPPPRWSRRHSTEMRPAAIALVRSLKIREK